MTHSDVEDGVQKITFTSWREFHDYVIEKFTQAPAYIYRGQTNYEWLLRSSLDRRRSRYPKRKNLAGRVPDEFKTPPLTEDEQLQAFKLAVRGRVGEWPRDDKDFWALGQHNGLATPLLDWTLSPFVALFFAFEQEYYREYCEKTKEERLCKPEDRGVYALSTVGLIDKASDKLDRSKDMHVVTSCDSANDRLISQAALLVHVPKDKDVEKCVRAMNKDNDRQAALTKIKIPNEDRHDCLVALHKMNINYMSLFSDVGGAARHVNSLWQPGHEDALAYL